MEFCKFHLRTIILLVAIFAVVTALPNPQPNLGSDLAGKKVSVLKDHREFPDSKGNYKYDIELSDGTKLAQEGKTEPGETEESLVVSGSYSYIAPDGTPVKVSYVSDKDGFRPISDTSNSHK